MDEPSGISIIEIAEFVLANTQVNTTAHVPEIRLHLGVEALPLWQAIEHILGRTVTSPPYWAFAWAGGQSLARYLLDHPQLVAGRRVLDLASGSGIAAIAAAKAGAARVIANDIDAFAVAAIVINADANGVTVEPTGADLLADESAFAPESVDVVIAADICYERDTGARAMTFLRRCRAAGALVIIGDPGREHLPQQTLVKRAEYMVPVTRDVQYTAAIGDGGRDHDLRFAGVWELAA
jgi:predicted nicotinamide N-methyase